MLFRYKKDGSLAMPAKKALNEAMNHDAGNWLRWKDFWRIDKSRFADPERGIIAYVSTEYTISNAILTRALVKSAAGSEKDIVWNGLPGQPFCYEKTVEYVSVMFFVRDEKSRPTLEYLMHKALETCRQDTLWLDEMDFVYRERIRCRIQAIELLESLLWKSQAWYFPPSADEQVTEAWYENEKECLDHQEYADLLDPTLKMVRAVAQKQGWKRIPRKHADERLEQSHFWNTKKQQLQHLAVRPPHRNRIGRKWSQLIADIQAFHQSLL